MTVKSVNTTAPLFNGSNTKVQRIQDVYHYWLPGDHPPEDPEGGEGGKGDEERKFQTMSLAVLLLDTWSGPNQLCQKYCTLEYDHQPSE